MAEEKIKLKLVVCLEGREYILHNLPIAHQIGKVRILNENTLYESSESPKYWPVLNLGSIEVPKNVFKYGDISKLEKSLKEHLTPEIKKRIENGI